jgi:hypothetical protein
MLADAFLKCVRLFLSIIFLRVHVLFSHQSNAIERDELQQSKKRLIDDNIREICIHDTYCMRNFTLIRQCNVRALVDMRFRR